MTSVLSKNTIKRLLQDVKQIIKNPLNVDINRYLPAGWVKAKPNFKSFPTEIQIDL